MEKTHTFLLENLMIKLKTKKLKMDAIENSSLDKIPSRLKYYLLEWKDRNLDDYFSKYGERRLRDLTFQQLHELFSYASTKDGAILARFGS